MKSIELRKDRAKLIHDAGELLKTAHAEARTLTQEENTAWEKLHADADALLRRIEQIERQEAADKTVAERALVEREDTGRREGPSNDPKENARLDQEAFRSFCFGGWTGIPDEYRAVASRHKPSATLLRETLAGESRAAQTVTTTGGGYLIPRGYQAEIDQAMLAYGGARQAARVLPTATGNTMDWPTVNDTAVKGRLLAINTAITDTALTFGTVTFNAYKFSSDSILVPSELMQDAAFGDNFDSFLREALAERLGRITNDYFTTGTGTAQPQGIVAGATASGITGFDISDLAAVATSYTWYNQLVELEHSVDPAYRPGSAFMMHDTMLRDLKKVKDIQGNPIWQPGLTQGAPDTILGYPYSINQSMANTGTNANIPILFGNMKKFVVRAVRPMVLLRLTERYADVDQICFIAFSREDSRHIDAGTHPIKSATVVT